MFLKKSITILVVAAQLCSSLDIESIAKYEGQHSGKCIKHPKLTGTLLNDKVYVFGGCYPVAYMVDPENNLGPFGFPSDQKYNTTDSIYSYNISQDKWALLDTRTPVSIYGADFQVVNSDIYMFNIQSEPDRQRSSMWKYATKTNEWQVLQQQQLPFVWRFNLISCEHDGVIYFTGAGDGEIRSIIQRYDTHENRWKSPLYLDQTLMIHKMVCTKDAIQLIVQAEIKEAEMVSFFTGEAQLVEYSFYTASYVDGKTTDSEFKMNMTLNVEMESLGDWLYLYDVLTHDSSVSKVNLFTKEIVNLGTIAHKLTSPLFVPYKDESAYLIGGSDGNMFFPSSRHKSGSELKTYNHKVKFNQGPLVITSDEQIVIDS